MRKKSHQQSTIFDILPDHRWAQEYQAISNLLDQHPRILQWVADDLGLDRVKPTGRNGLSAESILRAAIIKQQFQLSYNELVFQLADSMTLTAFCRLGGRQPSKSVLQAGIARIRAETWEKINRALLVSAAGEGIETGRVVRTDATPIESDIHKPTDSGLLWDAVRVMARMMERVRNTFPKLAFANRTRAAKKRAFRLQFASKKVDKVRQYRDLLRYTLETVDYMENAVALLASAGPDWAPWCAEAERIVEMVKKVVSQTKRRVLHGERVPVDEKLFSLFEDHTDIVVKGRQDVTFGHKINLTTGKSGLVLDLVVEEGNPADVDRAVVMIERQTGIYGRAPRQCAFDGAYASRANLERIKALGVKDVMFQKKRGLKVEEMAKSPWVYRRLRNFRAGVESAISCLKRAYGWTRCTWKGLAHFKAYTWASAVAYNLTTLGRRLAGAEAQA